MPTQHPRIPVTKDATLAEALLEVAPFFPGKKPATVVHDLAVKGAEAVLREQGVRERAIRRLINRSTTRSDSLDRDVLERVDELAWGD
ncbi:MAG: hypothetical protein ACYDCH_10720 [Gaiellaceae bacterium]